MEQQNQSISKANTLLGLQFLSDFGDQIIHALLAVCLLDITKSTGKVGFVYFITTAGYLLFTFVGGFIGDKLSRKNILFSSNMGKGMVVLLLILAVQEKSIMLIYATSFLLSILGSLNSPVRISIWAESIPSKLLERYNSLSELSVQASIVIGPLIASFFVVRELIGVGFAIDSLAFFMCAIIFSQVIANKSPEKAPKTGQRSFLNGFRIIKEQPELYRYVSYDAIQMIGFGAFNATFLVLAQRDFGWSKLDYSYHLSIAAGFTVLGALIGATNFAARMNHVNKLIACGVISAVSLWAAIRIQAFPMSSILVGICNSLAVLTMAVTRTKVQLFSKEFFPENLSSIIASRAIIIKGATLFGTGACLLIDDFISLENTLTLFIIPIALSIVPMFGRKAAVPASVGVIDN
jgi:DHA3 family macrolide efflux protein-like MFS transporter